MSKQLTLSALLSVMIMIGFVASTYDAPTYMVLASAAPSAIAEHIQL